jgi:hypothetical protein
MPWKRFKLVLQPETSAGYPAESLLRQASCFPKKIHPMAMWLLVKAKLTAGQHNTTHPGLYPGWEGNRT